MATPTCSHWWHCPIYLAMSITLAAIAISSIKHSSKPAVFLSPNASLALQFHGFSSFDSLLSLSPELFLLAPQTTLFAIPDKHFNQLNSNPKFLNQLVKYHSVPFSISFSELKNKPEFTCFHTMENNKRVGITKTTSLNSSMEINNVLVSHPDLFLDGTVVVHGVTDPFTTFGQITEPFFCGNQTEIKDVGQWVKAIRFLSSNGYVPFGIGLSSVLDGVIQENPNLISATIFAPISFGFVSSSWGLLGKIVRYHVVPGKLLYADLASLSDKSLLKTLVLYKSLVVNVKNDGVERRLRINGVDIIAPNAFLSQQFVIHGISRALTMDDLPSTSL